MADDKVILRISVDEDVKNLFRSDSMADGSNMSLDIEQLMLNRNRERRSQIMKAAQKKLTDAEKSSSLDIEDV